VSEADKPVRGPEPAPEFARRLVLGRWQAAGLVLLLGVPVLALGRLLGDRVESHALRTGEWVLVAEVPACAREGNQMRITVRLARAAGGAEAPLSRVELSADYLSRFSAVRPLPSGFGDPVTPARVSAPMIIELTPEGYGWARGRLGVVTETGQRLELAVKTFVFP